MPYQTSDNAFIAFEGTLEQTREREITATLAGAVHSRVCIISLVRVPAIDRAIVRAFIDFRRTFIAHNGGHNALRLLVSQDGALRRSLEEYGLSAVFSITYVDSERDSARVDGYERSQSEPAGT